ncbi:Subtilisin-like protease SBT5.3, partial [Linum perenne]
GLASWTLAFIHSFPNGYKWKAHHPFLPIQPKITSGTTTTRHTHHPTMTLLLFLLPLLQFVSLFLLSILLQKTAAAHAGTTLSYVVYMGTHSHNASVFDSSLVEQSHFEFLGSFLSSNEEARDAIFYSYTRHINGFAANLDEQVAAEIAKHPKVVSVFLNRGRKLHTTHSWTFLGVEESGLVRSGSIWKKARFGEDVIIGNLDTGVWPESKSFSDQGLGPIPSKWKGICQNHRDSRFRCNRKLIGARYFNKGYESVAGKLKSPFFSPRDQEGHGSHTLSTAAGNFVPGASVFGFGNGTAKGGSPKARVATYRVCYPPVNGSECFDADIVAAFDAAIADGVDVLSVSLGGEPTELFNDSVALGSFHAIRHGISVICSAGNSGPSDSTVSNVAPWEITVAASTTDREFPSYVVLGNRMRFKIVSQSSNKVPDGFFSFLVVVYICCSLLCMPGSLDRKKVKGKILVCLRGITARVDKGEQATLAGAVGMVLVNDFTTGNEVIADAHVLPASHVNYPTGLQIFDYITSTKKPTAYITPSETQIGKSRAPSMAAFSSKGPNRITPEILKPDITAPGVSVIAAYTEEQGPTNAAFDKRRVQFNSVSGTSMSCPHVSGVVGLLRTLYPHWSPAAIKSAIMTTANTKSNNMKPILNASNTKANPFNYGAGHIRPNKAMDPGLIYDLTVKDYLNFLCALGYNENQISSFSQDDSYKCPSQHINLSNFNYPSISIPNFNGSMTITRTVRNVGPPATYKARTKKPTGISVSVEPGRLEFRKAGEEKTFRVVFNGNAAKAVKEYAFGELVWTDGKRQVKSPIVLKWAV